MRKKVTLKDQSEVVVREMKRKDLEASLAFFESLPARDRAYLRRDVTRREVVQDRIREIRTSGVKRLVAVVGDRIVADGSLELSGEGWKKHVGELRLIVARAYRRKGLGILMARELYGLAASARVEEIIVKMMRPQKAARSIFRKLGFREEVLLPDYVRDLDGKKQDMILMRCDLEALWQEMEDFLASGDWQRTR
jgi:L-amino acid N-acyltransferase YncA